MSSMCPHVRSPLSSQAEPSTAAALDSFPLSGLGSSAPDLGSNPPEIRDVDMEGSMAPEPQDLHAGANESAPEREESHGAGSLGASAESEDPAELSKAPLVAKNAVIILPPSSAEQQTVEALVST